MYPARAALTPRTTASWTCYYATWRRYTTDQIEDSGQHEVLNWFCLLGAMEELGRKPDRCDFIETWAFVSPVVFAHYLP